MLADQSLAWQDRCSTIAGKTVDVMIHFLHSFQAPTLLDEFQGKQIEQFGMSRPQAKVFRSRRVCPTKPCQKIQATRDSSAHATLRDACHSLNTEHTPSDAQWLELLVIVRRPQGTVPPRGRQWSGRPG